MTTRRTRARSYPLPVVALDVSPEEVAAAVATLDAATQAMGLVRRMALQLQTRNRELDAAQAIVDTAKAKVATIEAQLAELRAKDSAWTPTMLTYELKRIRKQNGAMVRALKRIAECVHNGSIECPVCGERIDHDDRRAALHSPYCLLAQVGGLPMKPRPW